MKRMTMALCGLSTLALAGMLATQPGIGFAQENEPLMRGFSNVTPADEMPAPAADRLSDDVSPTATANTTATNQVDDGVNQTSVEMRDHGKTHDKVPAKAPAAKPAAPLNP